MDIGSKIRNTRKEKGLSQVEVAQAAKIAVNSLRLYESNKRQPRIEQLQAIADALGTDVYAFIDSGFGALDPVLPPNMQGANLDHAKIDSSFLSALLRNLSQLDRTSTPYIRARNALFALAESSGLSDMALEYIGRIESEPIRLAFPMPEYPAHLPTKEEIERMAPAEREYYYLRLLADTAPDKLKKMHSDTYDMLNKLGKVEAVRRDLELAKLSKYTEADPHKKDATPSESPNDPPENKK